MIIIPTWDRYLNKNQVTALNIQSPYQNTLKDTDEDFEQGGFSGEKVDHITAGQITTGTLVAVATLGGAIGSSYVKLDGEKNQIVIADSSGIPKIVIGEV